MFEKWNLPITANEITLLCDMEVCECTYLRVFVHTHASMKSSWPKELLEKNAWLAQGPSPQCRDWRALWPEKPSFPVGFFLGVTLAIVPSIISVRKQVSLPNSVLQNTFVKFCFYFNRREKRILNYLNFMSPGHLWLPAWVTCVLVSFLRRRSFSL